MDLSAFKAYDIRGKYPEVVNEELAYKVGRALVQYLSAKTIVVGMDMRNSSESLKEKLIEGISCEAADVIDIGICATPMIGFAISKYHYDGGIMVSASHSPGDDNGLKMINGHGLQIGQGFGMERIKEIAQKPFTKCLGRGAVTQKDILSDYLAHILKAAEGIENLNVVIDYSNGVGSVSGKSAFARLDIDLTELYSEPDGNFPNHPANPHNTENMKDLSMKIKEVGADVGIFFDGDADRAQILDENGNIVHMDMLFALLAEVELKKTENKGKNFYFDLRFSKAVPDIIRGLGGVPKMMRVGNPFYKKALYEEGGVLAAEFSGHVMYAENNNVDDGLYCAIKTLKMLSDSNKPLSEMVKEVNKYEPSEEVSLEALNPDTVFERIRTEFPEGEEIELDGLYLDLQDGFISVRQSQTETQLFRVRVEAKEKKTMESRLSRVLEIIKS